MEKAKFNNLAKYVVAKIVELEADGWPPDCPMIYYHPKRPQSTLKAEPNDVCVWNGDCQ